jgi:hypothetical protein
LFPIQQSILVKQAGGGLSKSHGYNNRIFMEVVLKPLNGCGKRKGKGDAGGGGAVNRKPTFLGHIFDTDTITGFSWR